MKTLFVTLFSLGLASGLHAQTCQPASVPYTATQKRVLQEYLAECRQLKHLTSDKGVVSMTVYRDAKGQVNWWLSTTKDDRYHRMPPAQYATFDKDILLIYPADSAGRTLPVAAATQAAVIRCLDAVVGSRVVKDKEQFVEIPGPNGTTRKVRRVTVKMGNQGNDKHITFKNDGTVLVLIGV